MTDEASTGYVREQRREVDASRERFDRIAYARRVLEILRPRGMTVAVYASEWELRCERGRHWAAGPGATWAVVGVPPDASRAHIAYRLAELAGLASDPFVMDVLLAA